MLALKRINDHAMFLYVFNFEDFDQYAEPDSLIEDDEEEGDIQP